ncbi:hypothetical protein [Solimonas sp. SE-A11]|uniref:hypothetical protein n=1 Tax=Solimonas sp. SE-A11 TaxID=3054954 RepID=UPI00345F1C69
MTQEWKPSDWGRSFTGSPDWRLSLEERELRLTVAAQEHRATIEGESSFRVAQGLFWTDFTLHPGKVAEVKVDGLPNAQAATLIAALGAVLAEVKAREDVTFLRRSHSVLSDWLGRVGVTLAAACWRAAKVDPGCAAKSDPPVRVESLVQICG